MINICSVDPHFSTALNYTLNQKQIPIPFLGCYTDFSVNILKLLVFCHFIFLSYHFYCKFRQRKHSFVTCRFLNQPV